MSLTLKADFLSNPSLTSHTGPDYSITRTTKRRMVDADGYIRELQAGEAAFTGATFNHNLLPQSNAFSTSPWQQVSLTAASGAPDPDGGTNAWSLSEPASAVTSHFIYQVYTLPKAGTYRFSAYVKASNRTWFTILLTSFAQNSTTYFNLSNGTVGPTDNADNSGVVDVGGGWYRCWVELAQDGSDLAGQIRFYVAEADNDVTFAGLDQESLLIYKAQVESVTPAQTGPGTYVGTTTAAASSLTGTSNGLLVEEARTNICLQSETFDNATWSKDADGVLTANQTTAPDGSLTADQWADDAGATGDQTINIYQPFALSTDTTYTFSVFAKADQLDWVLLNPQAFGSLSLSAYFDLTNVAVGATGGNNDDQGIEDYGNGWCRCWITWTTDASDASGAVHIYLAEGDGDNIVATDGTSSIFIWGAQLEEGAFPTSYIPTTTASVTRNADVVSTSDMTWLNQSAGSVFVDATPTFVDSGLANEVIFWYLFTTAANYHILSIGTTAARTGYGRVNVRNSASIVLENGENSFVSGTRSKAVYGYDFDTDALRIIVDGGNLGSTDANTTTAPTPDNLYVGSAITGNLSTNGHIAEIRYYDERLDNETLENMSNGIFPDGLTNLIALTRRTAKQMNVKQRIGKARKTLRGEFE